MPFLAQFVDARLEVTEILLGLFEKLFEFGDFVRLPRKLALQFGGQFVGLLDVV